MNKKKKVEKSGSEIKKKRKLSEYNKFIKKQMGSGMSMREAAESWKDHKSGLPVEHRTSVRSRSRNEEIEDALIRNMIELQKVHTDMAVKFDNLSKEISHLLALFESTARTFAKTAPMGEFEKDKEFLEKIDRLLDQNKVLAKGLTLMEERLRERVYGSTPSSTMPPSQESISRPDSGHPITTKRPLPKF